MTARSIAIVVIGMITMIAIFSWPDWASSPVQGVLIPLALGVSAIALIAVKGSRGPR